MTQYSIAEARDRFTQLVHQVEEGTPVEVTRRGQRVAVLVSAETYDKWHKPKKDYWASVLAWREEYAIDDSAAEEEADKAFEASLITARKEAAPPPKPVEW